nr:NAD-dependent epimerase/dehydratase family protein [Veillonella denticariosi]
MNICVTGGGAGFIGSHLVDRLIDLGHNVLVIDNLSTGGCVRLYMNGHSLKRWMFEMQI